MAHSEVELQGKLDFARIAGPGDAAINHHLIVGL